MPGEPCEARRGKGIHSTQGVLVLRHMDSLPLASFDKLRTLGRE